MGLRLTDPLAVIDLETTGTNVAEDRIVEIGIVKLMPDGRRSTFHKRINPERAVPAEASLVHGIYTEDLTDEPTFEQIGGELMAFLEGADLAGFNLFRFDLPVLVESFLRAKFDFKLDNRKIVDAQKLYHLMEKRTLKAAYRFYCAKELTGAHSAMVDALATLEVLTEQVKRYENQPAEDHRGNPLGVVKNDVAALHALTVPNVVDVAAKMIFDEQNRPVFNFGKYKGKVVSEALKLEPSYYTWMMAANFPLDTKRKLTEIKLGTV